jgi:hypothetical protein
MRCANDGVGGKISTSCEFESEAAVEEVAIDSSIVLRARGGPFDQAEVTTGPPSVSTMIGIGDCTTCWISPLESTNTGVAEYGGANADRPSRISLGGPFRQADWMGAGRSFLVSFLGLMVSSLVGSVSAESVSALGISAATLTSTGFGSSLSSQRRADRAC